MKNLKTVWILVAILASLVLFVLIFELPGEKYDKSEKYLNESFISGIIAQDISQIEISNPANNVTIKKIDGIFNVVSDDTTFPAAQDTVNAFIDSLLNIKLGTKVSSNESKLDTFGLTEDKGTRVKLFVNDQEKVNFIAGFQEQNGLMYFKNEGSNDIYLSKSVISGDLNRNKDNWKDMAIVTFNNLNVAELVIKSEGKKANYTKKEDGAWQKDGTDLSDSTSLTEVLTELSNLKASEIEPSTDFPSYNLEDGKENVKIYVSFTDGSSETVLVGQKDQDFYAKNVLKDVIFKIAASTIEKIKTIL